MITVCYDSTGDDRESGRMIHPTVAVPSATAESLNLPAERRSDAVWLVNAGTSGAYLRILGM